MPHPVLAAVGRHGATFVTGSYLGLCLLAGGGTRQGLPVEAVLQVLALLLLPYALHRLTLRPPARAAWVALAWFGLLAAVIAVALIPLPVSLWQSLAGRDELARELALAGVPIGARPISLDPEATLRALFALLPPLAIGLLMLGLHRHQQVRLLQGLLIVAIVSALLGLAQIASGPDSPLRWHAITNPGSAVGAFANRNHLATLLVVALPLAAAQMINAGARIVAGEQRPRRTAALIVGIVAGVLLLLSLAIAQSRAGVLLAAIAACACALMLWRRHEEDDRPRRGVKRWLALAGIGGLILAIQFGFWGLMPKPLFAHFAGQCRPRDRAVKRPNYMGVAHYDRNALTRSQDARARPGLTSVRTQVCLAKHRKRRAPRVTTVCADRVSGRACPAYFEFGACSSMHGTPGPTPAGLGRPAGLKPLGERTRPWGQIAPAGIRRTCSRRRGSTSDRVDRCRWGRSRR
ncbi:MAG: hypothetical protein IPP28_02370 [Xanthomonadales bacterium]|nr:hypothetical protein [Xanthomonadales bacterium]